MKNDGGSAFPYFHEIWAIIEKGKPERIKTPISESGMSLRDWFAGQALNGIVSGASSNASCAEAIDNEATKRKISTHEVQAWAAYQMADDMLKERKK